MIKIASILLVLVGLLQSIGHVFGSATVKQVGFLTVASPLPIVFTQQKGFLETFALEFTVVHEEDGIEKRVEITPELYATLDKPYNYRNVLGAAISYGPVLPEPLVESVLSYAFVEPAPLAKALGVAGLQNAHIELRAKTKDVNQTYILPIKEQL